MVYSCGKGNYSRLGQGHSISLNKVTLIEHFKKLKVKVVDIEAGGRHSMAIATGADPEGPKELYVWGFGYYY